MADKPRILQDSRDLIWSMVPLVLIALVVAGIAGSCSFGFGSHESERQIPSFDVKAGLDADAASMPFPVRRPDVPKSWQANSGSTQEIGNTVSSNVGWITDDGAYVQLTQTNATEDALVMKLAGSAARGDGVQEIAGQKWVAYTGERDSGKPDTVWIADLGNVRIAVKSRGSEENIRTLATAVTAATPIAVKGPLPAPAPSPAPATPTR